MPEAPWPISFEDVLAARQRLRPHLPPTPLRRYEALDERVGRGIRVFVKHENHNPTNAFKARNGLAAVSALTSDERRRGVIAASAGNHGLGLAHAGRIFGVRVVVCVPTTATPGKVEAIRGLGAEVVAHGQDYGEAVERAAQLARQQGLTLVHSTDCPAVIAGAGTITLEMLEQQPDLEAIVVSLGGGSQAVGALTVLRGLRRRIPVYAVQAKGASVIHDSYHARRPLTAASTSTIADGLATRSTYATTFDALLAGLTDFLVVSESEIAEAVRTLIATTHNLVEPSGAVPLAGLLHLRERLADRSVAIVLSGANIDETVLRRIFTGEI
jgi:threonine dehydratase